MNTNSENPRSRGGSYTTWILIAVLMIGGGWLIARKSLSGVSNTDVESVAPPAPTPLTSGDDPAYDWERPGQPQAKNSGAWTYAINPRFANSRTLQQTTSWLRWAVVSYGAVKEPADSFQISDVKFPGCSMQWNEKRFIDRGNQINETVYTANLGELDINYGAVQAYGSSLRIASVNADGIRKLERFWEKDGPKLKAKGERSSTDNTAVLMLQDKDDISRRAGWAMVHAASLCGSKPSR